MTLSSGSRVRVAAAAAAVAMVAASGVSAASAASSPGVSPAGPQPKGVGLLSEAALAQDSCSDNGRTDWYWLGDGPFCVNPWEAGTDNGGATAQGVTDTSVKVVGYFSNDEMMAASGETQPKNTVTGAPATWQGVAQDYDASFAAMTEQLGAFQLWGRTPEVEVVLASGLDEAAQRADALAILEKKPFMVFDMANPSEGGSAIFSSVIAAEKIIGWSASTTPEIAREQDPYRWNFGQDPDTVPALAAAFVGRTLSGKKAQFAGDDAMAKQTRKFGVIYPNADMNYDVFTDSLKETGGATLTEQLEFDPDPARSQEQATTFVTKLKSSGVTTVVLLAFPTMVGALMEAATAQDYAPEWVLTGTGYHDYPLFPRTWDQEQAAHAFGLGVLSPDFSGPTPADSMDPIKWYFGSAGGRHGGSVAGMYLGLYQAMHYAGPTLTPKNVKKGLFAAPAYGGAADDTTVWRNGFGSSVDMPYDEYGWLGSDRALIWYDPEGTIEAMPGKGAYRFMEGGKRFGYADFPKQVPKFFDEGDLRDDIPVGTGFTSGTVPDVPPCTGCPSSNDAA